MAVIISIVLRCIPRFRVYHLVLWFIYPCWINKAVNIVNFNVETVETVARANRELGELGELGQVEHPRRVELKRFGTCLTCRVFPVCCRHITAYKKIEVLKVAPSELEHVRPAWASFCDKFRWFAGIRCIWHFQRDEVAVIDVFFMVFVNHQITTMSGDFAGGFDWSRLGTRCRQFQPRWGRGAAVENWSSK